MSPERQPRGPEPVMTGVDVYRRASWRLSGPLSNRQRSFVPTDWRLKLDPENTGSEAGWGEQGIAGETVPAEVPGVWNTAFPGYSGVAWYEAICQPDRELPFRGTIRLIVDGANYLTDVWLNGIYLGRHEGGYEGFAFRCTDLVRPGLNRVTLRIVDPPLDGEIDGLNLRTSPTAKESWYGGAGGPWGGVWFEETAWVMRREPARVWVEDVRVHTDLVTRRATFSLTLASSLPHAAAVEVAAYVGEVGSTATVEVPPSGTTAILDAAVPSPRPWSPESPTLYPWQVGVKLPGEPWTDTPAGWLGFRTCEMRDGVFYLNGEPRYLKGALLQPIYPRTMLAPTRPAHPSGPLNANDQLSRETLRRWLAEMPPELWTEDVRIAKEAGLNLLRCPLRPPPAGFLNRCDREGIMAYVEPPLAWIEPSGRLLEHG